MSKGISFKFTGDKKLIKTLRKLPKVIQRQVLSKSIRASANSLKSVVKSLSPVKSGKLIHSYTVRRSKSAKRGEVAFNILTGTRKQLSISDKGNEYYPAIQEFGSSKAGVKALHYMRRAKESFEGTYKALVTNSIRKFTVSYRGS